MLEDSTNIWIKLEDLEKQNKALSHEIERIHNKIEESDNKIDDKNEDRLREILKLLTETLTRVMVLEEYLINANVITKEKYNEEIEKAVKILENNLKEQLKQESE